MDTQLSAVGWSNDRNYSAGSCIEDIVTENKYRTLTGLLMAAHGIQIRPANLAS
jgi:hypothetical protein